MKNIIGFVVLLVVAGCAASGNVTGERGSLNWLNETSPSEVAHLIISASAYPAEQAQPHWIKLGGSHYGARRYWMPADADLISVGQSHYQVTTINFNESHERTYGDILRIETMTPLIDLKSGVIHYYGKLVVDRSGGKQRLKTELDLDLLQRACARSPELFEQFELVVVGPLADEGVSLPPCESD